MKILVIGSGGREHAIVKKLKQSKHDVEVFVAPGNAGMAKEATLVNLSPRDCEGVVAFSKDRQIDLVVVAPDDPLVLGMVDCLEEAGIRAYGPTKNAAIIEGSKIFAKDLMQKYFIPTASYATFDDVEDANAYIENYQDFPVVIKADGLAFGKGVRIAQTKQEALLAVQDMMIDKVFGKSGKQIVVEAFLEGIEVSVLAFTDGHVIKPMVSSMDHKRALDGDQGLNTGGMGVIAPNPYYTEAIQKECMEKIFIPTLEAMKKENRLFKGTLYFGLILTKTGVKVIEYNCRFGDPETQVCLPLLEGDLVDIFLSVIDERLSEVDVKQKEASAACIVAASGGYPGNYEKNKEIKGFERIVYMPHIDVYHAGTQFEEGKWFTNGGRVFGVTAIETTLQRALDKAYEAIEQIHFEKMHYRRDIGQKAVNLINKEKTNGSL